MNKDEIELLKDITELFDGAIDHALRRHSLPIDYFEKRRKIRERLDAMAEKEES